MRWDIIISIETETETEASDFLGEVTDIVITGTDSDVEFVDSFMKQVL